MVLLLVIGLVTALALGACGGDDEKGEVEAAVRAVANAWNQRDVEGLLARGTDEWLQEEFEGTREELRQFLPEFMGEPTFTVRKISNTKVSSRQYRKHEPPKTVFSALTRPPLLAFLFSTVFSFQYSFSIHHLSVLLGSESLLPFRKT